MEYLRRLEAERGVLVGQFGFYGDGETIRNARAALQEVIDVTGQSPALTGCDFGAVGFPTMQAAIAECVSWAKEAWQRGLLVNISWHAPNPFGKPPAGQSPASCLTEVRCDRQQVAELLGGSGAAYARYRDMLGQVMAGLESLKAAGVVVIWRPFHEMNGAWFWWHQQAKESFVALWRDMHAAFAQRGLDNVLWAYSPNTPWDKWATAADFYYPGADVVDIVGLDWYAARGGGDNLNAFGGYDQLARLPHPFLLLEYGPHPASGAGWQDAPFDWRRLMAYLERYPRIVGFQAWEWIFRIGYVYNGKPADNAAAIRGLIDHPRAITLSELPQWEGPGAATATPQPSPTATPTLTAPSPTPLPSATATPERRCPPGWTESRRVVLASGTLVECIQFYVAD
jgi:mannan endo-1,4-beta-mannosidase